MLRQKNSLLKSITKVTACRKQWNVLGNVLVDIQRGFWQNQICWRRENRHYCKKHGIRLSGSKLGRLGKTIKEYRKQEYQDNTNRIETERSFSLGKRCYSMGLIVIKLEQTQLTSIVLSVFVMNFFRLYQWILFALFYMYDYFMMQLDWLSPKRA